MAVSSAELALPFVHGANRAFLALEEPEKDTKMRNRIVAVMKNPMVKRANSLGKTV